MRLEFVLKPVGQLLVGERGGDGREGPTGLCRKEGEGPRGGEGPQCHAHPCSSVYMTDGSTSVDLGTI